MNKPRAERREASSYGQLRKSLPHLRARLAPASTTSRAAKARAYLRIAEAYAALAEATLDVDALERP